MDLKDRGVIRDRRDKQGPQGLRDLGETLARRVLRDHQDRQAHLARQDPGAAQELQALPGRQATKDNQDHRDSLDPRGRLVLKDPGVT